MCSRFTLTSKPILVGRLFGIKEVEDFPPRYNIAPSQPVLIARTGYSGRRELSLVRWGLIPGWVKDPGEFSTLINARAETLLEKPSFRTSYKYKRCLFPMNGFYEWTGPKGHKQPHYFSRKDGAPFAVAGVWEHWMSAEGSELETAAIITVPPNAELSRVHNRMPAVLARDQFDEWFNCRDVLPKEVQHFLRPAPDGFFRDQPVSVRVNSPVAEGPELIVPTGQQDLF